MEERLHLLEAVPPQLDLCQLAAVCRDAVAAAAADTLHSIGREWVRSGVVCGVG